VSSRSPSQQAAQRDLDQELAIAERRGAARVRAQVRDLLDDRRRIVRVGEHQIEVVEVAALADLFVDEPE
jgi:hypothetical protein